MPSWRTPMGFFCKKKKTFPRDDVSLSSNNFSIRSDSYIRKGFNIIFKQLSNIHTCINLRLQVFFLELSDIITSMQSFSFLYGKKWIFTLIMILYH